jgi:hypothetical protein
MYCITSPPLHGVGRYMAKQLTPSYSCVILFVNLHVTLNIERYQKIWRPALRKGCNSTVTLHVTLTIERYQKIGRPALHKGCNSTVTMHVTLTIERYQKIGRPAIRKGAQLNSNSTYKTDIRGPTPDGDPGGGIWGWLQH